MRKRFIFIYIPIAFLFCACNSSKKQESKPKGRTMGNLYLSETNPKPGDQLTIRYSSMDSTLNETTFSPYYYIIVKNRIYGYDISMNLSDSAWEGEITIPDSATLIAFNFKIGEKKDNNDGQGYLQPLYSKNGTFLPGTRASMAYLHAHFYQNPLEIKPKSDSIFSWLSQDIKKNPQIERDWGVVYARLLPRNDSSKFVPFLKKEIKKYNQKDSMNEEEFKNLISYYKIEGDQHKQDSLTKVAIQKYPKSELAAQEYLMRFKKALTTAEKNEIFEAYNKNIGREGTIKYQMINTLAQTALDQKDYTLFQKYAQQLYYELDIADQYNDVAINLKKEGVHLDIAENLAKKAIRLVNPKKNTDVNVSIPKSVWLQHLQSYSEMYKDTYASVLFKEGKLKEALKQEKQAVGEGNTIDINERYIQYLIVNKDYPKAKEEAEQFIETGKSSKKIENYFKIIYVKIEGSDKGFNKELLALIKKSDEKIFKALKAEMLNKKTPFFQLYDANGDTITSTKLKGKVTILDFWATWCGPCKASFPGMKKLVNYFKDDPNVQFYFVNTLQREAEEIREKKVMKFITEHKYPFHILYDKKGKNHFKAVTAFGIVSIPTQIIIDPQGKWQFTKNGLEGSPEKMEKDVKMMIDLAENKTSF